MILSRAATGEDVGNGWTGWQFALRRIESVVQMTRYDSNHADTIATVWGGAGNLPVAAGSSTRTRHLTHHKLDNAGERRQTARVGISPGQFAQLQQRVSGKRRSRRADPDFEDPNVTSARLHQVILGVDPSLRGTGYGIIRTESAKPHLVTAGTIPCPARWERSRCLAHISVTLRDVLRETRPTVCVMEGLFFAQNLQTAIIMGEARGASLAAVAELGLEIFEIAPRKVKQAVVGYGAAQKLAVAKMVQRVLALSELPAPDAADALAVALAFAQTQGRHALSAPKRI